jgi:hypothetical protein
VLGLLSGALELPYEYVLASPEVEMSLTAARSTTEDFYEILEEMAELWANEGTVDRRSRMSGDRDGLWSGRTYFR